MSNPTPTPTLQASDLGHQLLFVLEKDGSAPALDLLAHLKQANGNVAQDEAAVMQFLASGASLAPQLIADLNQVLFGWSLIRVTHWLGNLGITRAAPPVGP